MSTPTPTPTAPLSTGTPTTPSPDWYARRINNMRDAMRAWGPPASGGAPACDPFQGIVPSSLASVMEARHAFTEESRSFVSTTLIMFSAAGALIVVPYAQEQDNLVRDMVCHALASLCLVIVWPVTAIMMKTAEAGYELYVANATYSAIVHRAAGIGTVPAVINDSSMTKDEFEEKMRETTDLPHSWLDGVERSRNRAVYFKDVEQGDISRFIDWCRGWPAIINLWGSRDAFPGDHYESRGQKLRPAADPREVHSSWATTGQTLLHSLKQTMWFARAVATLGAIGLMSWTLYDLLNESTIYTVRPRSLLLYATGAVILILALRILARRR